MDDKPKLLTMRGIGGLLCLCGFMWCASAIAMVLFEVDQGALTRSSRDAIDLLLMGARSVGAFMLVVGGLIWASSRSTPSSRTTRNRWCWLIGAERW
jgi:hypothetical protein